MFHVKHHLSLFLVKNDEAKTGCMLYILTIMFFAKLLYKNRISFFVLNPYIFAFDSFILNAYALLKIT